MRFQIDAGVLTSALASVLGAVASKTTLPILGNVLMRARDGALELTATNLDITLARRVTANVIVEGAITLPAKLLSDYVRLLNKGTVELALNEKTNKVHLVCGRDSANITGIDAEDFPPTQPVDGTTITLTAAALKKGIDSVEYAAAPDDTRPVLAGVLFNKLPGCLTLASADGFRLAVRTIEAAHAEEFKVIVPAPALREVAKMLPAEGEDTVDVTLGSNGQAMRFSLADTDVTTRLISGQFPDYQRIIPEVSTTTATLSTADFLRATRAAAVFARDNSNIVRVVTEESSVTVKSTSQQDGDTEGHVEAEVDGESVKIAFSARYLRDALAAIDTAQVRLQLTGTSSPGLLSPVGDDSYTVVIMPMHVASK